MEVTTDNADAGSSLVIAGYAVSVSSDFFYLPFEVKNYFQGCTDSWQYQTNCGVEVLDSL